MRHKDGQPFAGRGENAAEAAFHSYAFMEETALYDALLSSPDGLSDAQAARLQSQYGSNIIVTGKRNTQLHRLLAAIINPFNIVLLAVAAITFFTDVFGSDDPDWLTVIIILLLVAISSAVAFIQDERSNAAAQQLSKMISNMTTVLRDGKERRIPVEQVVPGDILHLSSGDMIPADIRFLSTKDIFVAQSAMTGESHPVEKYGDIRNSEDATLTDLVNIGFMGTNVLSGSASAIVLAIGNATYLGDMSRSLEETHVKSSFERGVSSVSKMLIGLMFVMIPVVFLINGFTKNNWVSALLFSVSIAVGLMPEMLPVVMTSTLAKGAMAMSKQQVIVKVLGSIQTLGEMDVLCTDKTGTLTEDKIVLEKYMDAQGKDDARVLQYAYLNSYFQTGLKNLMDVAVINRAAQNGLGKEVEQYTRVDEIPFDFTRRRMSVVLTGLDDSRQLITKGAVEEMLSICSYMEQDGQVLPLNHKSRERAMATYERLNNDGLRMIAVARKDEVPNEECFGVEDERDMVLVGFVGFLDPPKESAVGAITALREHGVRTIVLTGDSAGVAVKVCSKVGVDVSRILTGKNIEVMNEAALAQAVKTCNLFAKLSPAQKERVVIAFQKSGHTVGYLGDGINDAPPLHRADVGISVDTAVDIAKETADVILLKKDLVVLEQGVIEGRRTFGNIVKYIKMAASGNFGNMISVLVASIFLPFLPMLPVQILAQNLLCDFSQMGIPFDRVDEDYLKQPRKWETRSIKTFMGLMGPLSSIFDILCFSVMWWFIGANTTELAPLFQCGWFVFGTLSQVLVIHFIRTAKIPFIQSRAAAPLTISTIVVALVALIVAFSPMAVALDMTALPSAFLPWLALLLLGYIFAAQLLKRVYIRWFGQWL